MISTQVLSHPAWRGDSRHSRMIQRAGSAEAVVGRIRAFAEATAQSREVPGDRTLLRFLAASVVVVLSRLLRAVGTIAVVRPEQAWSITQTASAPIPVSIRSDVTSVRNVQPLPCRTAASESPGASARAVPDETRDSDQCDPAGDPGCHPRGRRAR